MGRGTIGWQARTHYKNEYAAGRFSGQEGLLGGRHRGILVSGHWTAGSNDDAGVLFLSVVVGPLQVVILFLYLATKNLVSTANLMNGMNTSPDPLNIILFPSFIMHSRLSLK